MPAKAEHSHQPHPQRQSILNSNFANAERSEGQHPQRSHILNSNVHKAQAFGTTMSVLTSNACNG
jgi:hypothetical protein